MFYFRDFVYLNSNMYKILLFLGAPNVFIILIITCHSHCQCQKFEMLCQMSECHLTWVKSKMWTKLLEKYIIWRGMFSWPSGLFVCGLYVCMFGSICMYVWINMYVCLVQCVCMFVFYFLYKFWKGPFYHNYILRASLFFLHSVILLQLKLFKITFQGAFAEVPHLTKIITETAVTY